MAISTCLILTLLSLSEFILLDFMHELYFIMFINFYSVNNSILYTSFMHCYFIYISNCYWTQTV